VVVVLENSKAFSGIAVKDLDDARRFYGEVLGVAVEEGDMGMLVLRLGGNRPVLVYPKADHEPATYTVLNFPVDDVEGVVDALTGRGVVFERYEGTPTETDAKGVFRGGGPLIAWFTDPSGNVLSVIEGPGPA
jgi:predicted enzyme related to lactoylglutathione lyase